MKANYKTKILLIGPSGSKNVDCLIDSIKTKFNFSSKQIIGVNFLTNDIKIPSGSIYSVTIWDVNWDERFKCMRSNFFFGASGLILAFDLANPQTWQDIQQCLGELKSHIGKIPLVLIGNSTNAPSDLDEDINLSKYINYAIKNTGKFYNFNPDKDIIDSALIDLIELIHRRNKKASKIFMEIMEFFEKLIMSGDQKQIAYQNMDALNELLLSYKLGWLSRDEFLCRYFKGIEKKKINQDIKNFNPRHRLDDKIDIIFNELKIYLNEPKIKEGVYSTLPYLIKLVGSLKDGKMTPGSFIDRLNNFTN